MSHAPIQEIAFSVQLASGADSTILDVSSFLERFRDRFPVYQQAGRLPQIPATSVSANGTKAEQTVTINGLELLGGGLTSALVPRAFVISSDSSRLLQFQGDRVGYNWRRLTPLTEDSGYPGFVALHEEFKKLYAEFEVWFVGRSGVTPEATAVELTYVNVIPLNSNSRVLRLSDVLKFYRGAEVPRLIAQFAANWVEPMGDEIPGLTHVNFTSGVLPDGSPAVNASFTTRMSIASTKNTRDDWFARPHEAILKIFDFTIMSSGG
jgi:uncharacterized protein (TIGR04255 family)